MFEQQKYVFQEIAKLNQNFATPVIFCSKHLKYVETIKTAKSVFSLNFKLANYIENATKNLTENNFTLSLRAFSEFLFSKLRYDIGNF